MSLLSSSFGCECAQDIQTLLEVTSGSLGMCIICSHSSMLPQPRGESTVTPPAGEIPFPLGQYKSSVTKTTPNPVTKTIPYTYVEMNE